jgi:hypothetical protein
MKSLSSQFSFHKVIEIAVEYRLDVSGFVIRSMVFHELVRRLHVTANL